MMKLGEVVSRNVQVLSSTAHSWGIMKTRLPLLVVVRE